MDAKDYGKTWRELSIQQWELIDRRTGLETELSEITKQISHLQEVLNHLAPLAGISYGRQNISGMGMTDAIRTVLRSADDRLSAQEVREALAENGYDLSGLTAPKASIYKVLSRLTDDSGEVEREKEDGKIFYRWKKSEIADEDIPF